MAIRPCAPKSIRCDSFWITSCRRQARHSKELPARTKLVVMGHSDSTQTIFLSGPAGLARILEQDQPDAALWAQQELRAMWEHQMRAPIEADLGGTQPPNTGTAPDSTEASRFVGKSFREL